MSEKSEAEDTDAVKHSPELEPVAAGSYEPHDQPSGRTWAQFLQSFVLLLSCLASLSVAAVGFLLLLYIFFSRSYAPPAAHLVKDLYFDYTDSSAVASATFFDATTATAKHGQTTARRPIPANQKMNIWLELEAAEPYGNVNTDLFQVLAQLLTVDGRIAATASRPCLLTSWSPLVQSVRSFFTAPLVLAGLWREHQSLKVLLFSRYPDQADKPFAEFRTVLRAANTGGHLPHLYSAKVHVELVLGFFGRIIYWIRPGTWTMLALAGASVSAVIGGLLVAAAILLVWVYSGSKAHAPAASPPPSEDSELDDESESDLIAAKLDELKSQSSEEAVSNRPFRTSIDGQDDWAEKSSPEKPQLLHRTNKKSAVMT